MASDDLFISIKNTVLRIRKSDGSEVWRSKLPRSASTLVTIAVEEDGLYASAGGEVYRLNPDTGQLMWTSELPKLGRGTVLIASQAPSSDE
ncbi:MAG: PQQ-binding-like beta-propeller repeat protein [Gammaproteobacteria bacterium]|nr:PQQ-binding-like beta-propeller repeat protein [Gammaproteobacteria bacterium]